MKSINKLILNLGLFLVIGFILCGISFAVSDSSSVTVSTQVLPQPPNIYNINVENISPTESKIYWSTDQKAQCWLFYGVSTSYDNSRAESAFLTNHYFYLQGLMPSTLYHFLIKCQNIYGHMGSTSDNIFLTMEEKEVLPLPSPAPTYTPIPPYYPPVTPTAPLNWWEKLSKDVAESDWGQAAHWPMNIAALILSLLAMLLPLIMNLPMLAWWDQIYSWFLFIFGWAKKRKQWGIVYDADSGQPVPMAAVRIFNTENKLLKTELTDKDGRYGFEVKAGEYYMDVVKKDYFFPSKITKENYHKEIIKVKEDSLIYADIPIDPNVKKFIHGLSILSQIITAVNWMRIPILVVGTFLAMTFYTYNPTTLHLGVLAFYIILWIIELSNIFKPKGYGVVYESMAKTPVGLSIVRVFNQKDNKLVSTKVSDLKGHYFYLIRPGEYKVKVTKNNYEEAEVSGLTYKQAGALARDFFIRKINTESENIPPASFETDKPEENLPANDVNLSGEEKPEIQSLSGEKTEEKKQNIEKPELSTETPDIAPTVPAKPKKPKPQKIKKAKILDIEKKKKTSKYNRPKEIESNETGK